MLAMPKALSLHLMRPKTCALPSLGGTPLLTHLIPDSALTLATEDALLDLVTSGKIVW